MKIMYIQASFRMVRIVIMSVALIMSAWTITKPTSALSCALPDPSAELDPLTHLQTSTYVFLGVTGISTEQATSQYSGEHVQDVTVTDWLKGSTGESTVVYTSDSTWSAPLPAGQRYLFVYSSATLTGDEYNTTGKTEFNNPLCPGPNKVVINSSDDSYSDYESHFEVIRDGTTVAPSPTPIPPVTPPTTPLFGFSFGQGVVSIFRLILNLLF